MPTIDIYKRPFHPDAAPIHQIPMDFTESCLQITEDYAGIHFVAQKTPDGNVLLYANGRTLVLGGKPIQTHTEVIKIRP